MEKNSEEFRGKNNCGGVSSIKKECFQNKKPELD